MYNNRKYIIFETQETGSINFNEVLETKEKLDKQYKPNKEIK